MNGAELIARERERQVSQEGWTAEHDDNHASGQILRASENYLCLAFDLLTSDEIVTEHGGGTLARFAWPWEAEWWKPSADPVRNLVKAGALIAAEIDRLQRLAATPTGEPAREGGG